MDEGLRGVARLLRTIKTLRGPGGCGWDREQTLESLRPHLLEEAHEVAEALENRDWKALSEELGDLLLHILMWAEIGADAGLFSLEEIALDTDAKLVRRHPHVFLSSPGLSPEQVEKQWEFIKRGERREKGASGLSPGPPGVPGLQAAWRLAGKAADSGVEPLPGKDSILTKVKCFTDMPGEESLGNLLFSIAGVARALGYEPELALKRASRRFLEKHRTGLEEDTRSEEGKR